MPSRRTFLSLLAGGTVARHLAFAQGPPRHLALYANVGPVLTHYDVDLANAELIKRDSVTLPAGVHTCWPHRNRRYFYVASSSSAGGNVQTGTEHHVTTFKIDPTTGALDQIGDSMRLPVRPIHMTLDNESQHILVAFNSPSSLRVYRMNKDLTLGEEVPQGTMDAGIYAHQVRVTPDGRHVVLVTRGNEGTAQRPEDPGALMVFDYTNGVLSNESKIAPNGGRGYGPRHLDFHLTKPWMYVSIETRTSCTCITCRAVGRYRKLFSIRQRYLSPTTFARARRRARCTCIRMAVSCTAQTARRMCWISTARKSTRAARTASSCSQSTSRRVNRQQSSISKRKSFIRARSTSIPAGGCW